MRILQLTTAYQSIITILAPKLRLLSQASGIELYTCSSPPEPDEKGTHSGSFFPIYMDRKIKPLSDLKSILKLARLIKTNKIDLIHTHTAKAGIIGAAAGFFAGMPVVHTYHGLPFFNGQSRLANSVYKFIELFFSYFRKLIFSQNKYDFDILKSLQGLACPVVFEGNGVDMTFLNNSASEHIHEVTGLFDSKSIKILCVARLEPVKHLDHFIACISELVNKGLSVEALIAGKGPLKNELENHINQHGLSTAVRIVYTPFIHSLIAKADIVVLTSIKEGIPRGIMEAMAFAKPIVATDVLGTKEVVADGVTGYLTPFGDVEAMAKTVGKLATDPALCKRLGNAGRERIAQEFDETKIVGMWITEYKRLIG